VHAPPGALESTMIGSKLNSPIGGKPRGTDFVPSLAYDGSRRPEICI
jgi:hypothetical protein